MGVFSQVSCASGKHVVEKPHLNRGSNVLLRLVLWASLVFGYAAFDSLVFCSVFFSAPKMLREKANIQSNIYQGTERERVSSLFQNTAASYSLALPPLLRAGNISSRFLILGFLLSFPVLLWVLAPELARALPKCCKNYYRQ